LYFALDERRAMPGPAHGDSSAQSAAHQRNATDRHYQTKGH
jgi:hypothetical protein